MNPLTVDRLSTPCDPQGFTFETTADLPEPAQPFGQARAVQALRLGLDVAGRGYNLFVLGRAGSGRHEVVRQLLAAEARERPAPADWCYLYNFEAPHRPRAIALPAGVGSRLRDRMHAFAGELGQAIEAALESKECRSRIAAIEKEFQQREEGPLHALGDKAVAQGVALLHTPQGFAFTPLKGGEPMTDEQLEALTDAERARLKQVMESLREDLSGLVQQLPRLRREMQVRIRAASRDAMALAAGQLIDELKAEFAGQPQVLGFLDEVLKDVIEAGERLRAQPSDESDEIGRLTGTLSLVRYEVNLLVGHAPDAHAPLRECDNPSHPRLVGRIDHAAHLGTWLTNFTMIKPGALHLANGGYLMLDAVKVLSEPHAWESLKRALRTGQVAIEPLPQLLGWANTVALEPEPIPLQLKLVLFGEREHYYLLQELDPEFDELFKVAADFEDDVPRDAAQTMELVRLLGAQARAQGLRPLDRGGAARMVEQAARLSGDAARLSTQVRPLGDLLQEADAMAARAGHRVIGRAEVCEALAAAIHRADRLRSRLHDAVLNGTLLISTAGEHVGQVNGIAVAMLGEFDFGHPVRITATVRLGDGEFVDILRESRLGLPLHSKGVLILAAFLGARYSHDLPLSLQASLVFEQTYGPVEGDSASLAELCALLSALSGVPVRQSLAVTGSINQFGQVQAVGAVNEKIEGFFDVCRAAGLSGEQGVLIPRANVRHLMLRDDVIEAVAQGRFQVHAVDDVDEAIALLTGLPAGRVDAAGEQADGSVNHRVGARLEKFSVARQAYGTGRQPQAAKAWPGRPAQRRLILR